MRDFSDIRGALNLEKYLGSPLGTLYITPNATNSSRLIIRHLDRELPVALIGHFADFTREAQRWVERHPKLESLVRVEQPVEIGRDFIARRHHPYYTDISDYLGKEDAPKAPEELAQMQEVFSSVVKQAASPRDSLLRTVLARSLLEPSGKTYFNDSEGRFIVVEPKPTPDEIRRWAQLRPSGVP